MKDGLSLPFLDRSAEVKLKRWDVAVFKLPEEPEVRYIKRLVGMPNEVIRIDGGDLWVRPLDASADFERLLRPLDHQRAMQLPVYDDPHRAAALARVISAGCAGRDNPPVRGLSRHGEPTSLTPARPIGRSCGTVTLCPARRNGKRSWPARQSPGPPVPSLITDYYSYNTDVSASDRSHGGGAAAWFQPHWVGDLTMSLRLKIHEATGKVRLELIRAGDFPSL